jgi:hypothetical protein
MDNEERYFETKKAFQTLTGEALKKRLSEIYTPEVIAEVFEQEQRYVDPAKRDELRRELNRQFVKKQYRDPKRKKDYGERSTRIDKS